LTDEIAGTVVETAIARIHAQSQENGQRKAHEIIDLSNYLVKSAIVDKIWSGMKLKIEISLLPLLLILGHKE
jgi:hypothetical protein